MKYLRYLCNSLLLMGFFINTVYAEQNTGLKPFNFGKAYFYNFYSVSHLKDGHVWIVGSHGLICHHDPKLKEWFIQDSGTPANLYQVTFVNHRKGWIAGQNGLIIQTDNRGKTWNKIDSGTPEHLFSLSFTDSNKGWVVGEFGTILHTSNGGKTWARQGEKADKIYNSVFFIDSSQGWIVGEFGTILHTEDGGQTWLEQQSPLGEKTLFSVHFKDRYKGCITGMGGSMLTTVDGGRTWTVVNSPVDENLFSVQLIEDKGWTVGLKGKYAVYNGSNWNDATQSMPSWAWLNQIHFVDVKTGWVVGSGGTILHTTDGGRTWMPPWQSAKK